MPLIRLECGSKKSNILFRRWKERTQQHPSFCRWYQHRAERGGRPRRREGTSESEVPSLEPVRGDNMKRESITVYDYDDKPRTIQLPDKDIRLIHVTILSGDETGYVQFDDNTILDFDASNCRMQSFYDGSYTVIGDDKLAQWIDWDPKGREFLQHARKSDIDAWNRRANDENM